MLWLKLCCKLRLHKCYSRSYVVSYACTNVTAETASLIALLQMLQPKLRPQLRHHELCGWSYFVNYAPTNIARTCDRSFVKNYASTEVTGKSKVELRHKFWPHKYISQHHELNSCEFDVSCLQGPFVAKNKFIISLFMVKVFFILNNLLNL